jgi:hypothetical protein
MLYERLTVNIVCWYRLNAECKVLVLGCIESILVSSLIVGGNKNV